MDILRWSTKQVIIFLEIYEKYVCLWDASSPDYVKRNVKINAFENLYKELLQEGFQITEEKLKKIK